MKAVLPALALIVSASLSFPSVAQSLRTESLQTEPLRTESVQTESLQTGSIQPGIQVGVNFANIYGEDTDGGKIKTGLLIGGILHVPVSDQFAFQPEMLLTQQGTRGEEGTLSIRFNNTYLMLPLMGKMYITPSFVLQLGPQIGFLLSSKIKGGASGIDTSVDSRDLYKDVDFGINVGLSYESPNRLAFTTRYCRGLTDVIDRQIGDVNSKNTAWQLAMAYRFSPASE